MFIKVSLIYAIHTVYKTKLAQSHEKKRKDLNMARWWQLWFASVTHCGQLVYSTVLQYCGYFHLALKIHQIVTTFKLFLGLWVSEIIYKAYI